MRPEWGKKIVCAECENIFYDLCQQNITCAKCCNKFKSNLVKNINKPDNNAKIVAYASNDKFKCFARKDARTLDGECKTRSHSSEHKMAINFAEYDNLSIVDNCYVNNALDEGGLIMEDN